MQRIAVRALVALAVLSAGANAWGQWFDPCCAQQQCCALPAQGCGNQCVAQAPQQCFQTIPVTEIRECKQIVQRPVVETNYIDQPCTEYRQVCETKTCQVPTVQYQTVTEYRTVQRDMGHWVTNYQCNPRLSPCQYDCRPDLFGFINRTGYSMRMAMTPRMTATRQWCPNVVAHQVPVCRQVAVRGVQTVNYQVSRMVPYTTNRRVAVNTVRMVAQEIVTRHPVTVFRTVPVGGTATAYGGPNGVIGSTHAPHASANLQPTPAEQQGVRQAIRPRGEVSEKPGTMSNGSQPNKNPLPDSLKDESSVPKGSGSPPGASLAPAEEPVQEIVVNRPVQVEARRPVAPFASINSAARVGKWVASRTKSTPAGKEKSNIAVVQTSK